MGLRARDAKDRTNGRQHRINLSVPEELRHRMFCYPGICWSRVAQKAFRDLLDAIETEPENELIARLKMAVISHGPYQPSQGADE